MCCDASSPSFFFLKCPPHFPSNGSYDKVTQALRHIVEILSYPELESDVTDFITREVMELLRNNLTWAYDLKLKPKGAININRYSKNLLITKWYLLSTAMRKMKTPS